MQFIFFDSIDILIYFYTFAFNNLKKQYENTNDIHPAVWDIYNSNTCVRWRNNLSAIISCTNINLIYNQSKTKSMTIQEIQKVQALAITAISEINWRENNGWPSDYQSIESTQYLDGSIVIEYVTRVDIEHEKHGNGSPLTMVTDFYNINVPLTKSGNVNFKELYDLVEQAMEHIREVEITEQIK